MEAKRTSRNWYQEAHCLAYFRIQSTQHPLSTGSLQLTPRTGPPQYDPAGFKESIRVPAKDRSLGGAKRKSAAP